MPLSFRGNGAFIVNSKNIYDYKLEVNSETLKTDMSNLLETINEKVTWLSSTLLLLLILTTSHNSSTNITIQYRCASL